MDIQLLEDIGLSSNQAIAYKHLVEHGTTTASTLAVQLGESRTNMYKVLDKLIEFDLALKQQINKKFHYSAASPAALEQFVQKQSEAARQRERRLNSELPHLLDYYFAHSERPSIRYYEGADGLAKINKDQLSTGQPVKFIRSSADAAFLGFEALHKLRNNFPRLGIPRETIIQDYLPYELAANNRMAVEDSDKLMLLRRTWIDKEDYTAPVEWAVYGNKLSIIQFGEQAMGMVIESSSIADAFRQLYTLLDEGIKRRPDYAAYPKRAKYTAIPQSAKPDNA